MKTNGAGVFWQGLERFGDRIALQGTDARLSYAELAAAADGWAEGARGVLPAAAARPLVALEFPRSVAAVVAYVGCLRAGWPVILLAEGEAGPEAGVIAAFRPNLIIRWPEGGAEMVPFSPEPVAFCEGLAVLLSTSGTTGASKLVKLSAGNLGANAAAIAAYLGLTEREVAITTLPLHYSYGMSVLHSHLSCGARVVVTDAALTEARFWEGAKAAGVTSLALVPAQMEVLQKSGFEGAWLPDLRMVTQAGGRLDRHLAEAFARRAKAERWRLFLMYGQTEAGPRIAYLPPEEALLYADTIGGPIPGGRLWLEDEAGGEITAAGVSGELIYEGPNVMIGYALDRDDLALPQETARLRTGDIAERTARGHFRIVGRASRFVKLNGLRIGLDEVEASLRRDGLRAHVTGDDRKLVVFVAPGEEKTASGGQLGAEIAARYGLLWRQVAVRALEAPPLLPSGKVDYRQLKAMAEDVIAEPEAAEPEGPGGGALAAEVAAAMRRPDADPGRTFRDLGGDSLTYLEVELLLMKRLGQVPVGWDKVPLGRIAALAAVSPGEAPARAWQAVGTDALLRLVAILWVILLHSNVITAGGGVYMLMILVGLSLARNQKAALVEGRVLAVLDSVLRPFLLSYYVVLAIFALRFEISWEWLALVANFPSALMHSPPPDIAGPYWFVATYVQVILLAVLPFVFAPVRRVVKAKPFAVGLAVGIVLAIAIKLIPAAHPVSVLLRFPHAALVLVALGWCIGHAETQAQRGLVVAFTGMTLIFVWATAGKVEEACIFFAPLVLLWVPSVQLPPVLARMVLEIGRLTMFIYLLHAPFLWEFSGKFEAKWVVFLTTFAASVLGAVIARQAYLRTERVGLTVLRRLGVGRQPS